MEQCSFAVVVPMYNEQVGAEACVSAISQEIRGIDRPSALIAVNDGSGDRTGEILDELARKEPLLRVVHHPRNRGYGAALRTGVERAAQDGFDYVLFMDSDLTNDPRDIRRFAVEMDRSVDVIKASRYSKGGRMLGVPLYRFLVSAIGNGIARILFRLPIRDCTNGFRASKVGLLMKMKLSENRFPIIMEELYWCKFLAKSFAEVPVVLTNRSGDQRKTSFAYRPGVFYDYLKYPLRACFGIKPNLESASQSS